MPTLCQMRGDATSHHTRAQDGRTLIPIVLVILFLSPTKILCSWFTGFHTSFEASAMTF